MLNVTLTLRSASRVAMIAVFSAATGKAHKMHLSY